MLRGDDIYLLHRAWNGSPFTEQNLPMSQNELDNWTALLKRVIIIDADVFFPDLIVIRSLWSPIDWRCSPQAIRYANGPQFMLYGYG